MSTPVPISKSIADLLVTGGVGALGGTQDWAISINREQATPDKVVTVFDTGGMDPNPKWLLDYPSVQVQVRGGKGDYMGAYVTARKVKDLLLGKGPTTVNDDELVMFNMVGDINSVGNDANERPILTLNFRLIVQPQATGQTQRAAL